MCLVLEQMVKKTEQVILLSLLFLFISVNWTFAQDSIAEYGKEHDKLIEELLKRLESKDDKDRIAAGIALEETANEGDLPKLVETLKRGNVPEKQVEIIRVLGKLGNPRVAGALRFELEHGKELAIHQAITALGKLHTNWAIPILVKAIPKTRLIGIKHMSYNDFQRTSRGIVALYEIGTPRSIDALKVISVEMSQEFAKLIHWLVKVSSGEIKLDEDINEIRRGKVHDLSFKRIPYKIYNATTLQKTPTRSKLLVCIHDFDFNIEALFSKCASIAKQRRMATLVPFFHPIDFLEYGTLNIRGRRADLMLIELLDHVRKLSLVETQEIFLYGEGVGASFVQRFVMAYPRRIARAAAYNPALMLPDAERIFPVGIGINPRAPDLDLNIYDFLKTNLAIAYPQESSTVDIIENFSNLVLSYEQEHGVTLRIEVSEGIKKSKAFKGGMSYLFREGTGFRGN